MGPRPGFSFRAVGAQGAGACSRAEIRTNGSARGGLPQPSSRASQIRVESQIAARQPALIAAESSG